MKSWILTVGALAMVGGACNAVTLEPLEGAPSAEDPVAPGAPSAVQGAHPVLAMRAGDVNWEEMKIPSTLLVRPWSDPDTLVLFFSSDAQECSTPVLAARCNDEGRFWQFVIGIPPELARPGLIDLAQPRINQYMLTANNSDAPSCMVSGRAGPGQWGTVELIGDGSTTLSVKLRDVPVEMGATVDGVNMGPYDFNGDYAGEICGALPPILPPTPALAIRGADLTASPAGGSPPAPDSLVVFLGTLPDTCQDPWAAADCTTATRLSFTLPAALQKPGVISLSDPAIAATYTVAAAIGTSACGLPGGPLEYGTVEILGSDAAGLTFKVYKSSARYTAMTRGLYFDGLYRASICP
jgi:hypothetical protein